MIDANDKATQPLPLDEQPMKRKRGRPSTGKAMTPAEKQRAYRLRKQQSLAKAVPAGTFRIIKEGGHWDLETISMGLTLDEAKTQLAALIKKNKAASVEYRIENEQNEDPVKLRGALEAIAKRCLAVEEELIKLKKQVSR